MAEINRISDEVRWHVMDEAIRGFFFEKHLPFSIIDGWTEEIVAIVAEHLGGPANDGAEAPR